MLGPERSARLQEALTSRAMAWAARVGEPFLFEREDETSLGDRLAGAAAEVFARHDGPVLLATVDVPQLGEGHAAAALDDLADGIDVTVGPSSDGGYYLVGLREPHPEVFALPDESWGGPEVFARTLAVAGEAGLTLGMLRAERGLHDPADVAAFLADPLTPPEICAILRGGSAA